MHPKQILIVFTVKHLLGIAGTNVRRDSVPAEPKHNTPTSAIPKPPALTEVLLEEQTYFRGYNWRCQRAGCEWAGDPSGDLTAGDRR